MAEGQGPRKNGTVTGLATTVVITIGALIESKDIIELFRTLLALGSPALATQPVATLAFIAFIGVLCLLFYWLKRHYDHKDSRGYKPPDPKRKKNPSKRRRR